jgi:ankyrin repeat protein
MTSPTRETEQLFDEVQHHIKHGDIIAVRNLLDDGLCPNFANKHGFTILILAAHEGNTAIGELLISRGADVNLGTSHGAASLTPFGSAAAHGHIGFVKLLLDHGAAPSQHLEKWLPKYLGDQKRSDKILAAVQDAADRQKSN